MKKNDTYNYIRKIVQTGNISIAAEQLGISQPALSSYLKKIEGELGTILFDRSRQPLELTESGKVYLEYMDETEALQRRLMQSLADIDDLKTGSLTIGGASFFNVSYLPKAVAAFAEENPGIEIEIIDDKVPELVAMAQKGILDIFITPNNDDHDRFVYEELLDDKIYLAVPEGFEINNRLKAKAVKANFEVPLELSDNEFKSLCENTFLVLKQSQDIGHKMQALFQRYNCTPKRVITAEQTMTTLALTLNGVGISLITRSSINNSRLSSLPKLYMADPEICSRKIYVAYPRNKYLSKAAMRFIELLREKNR